MNAKKHATPTDRIDTDDAPELTDEFWSSQDLVETFALLLEVGLEVIRADTR